MSAAELLTPPTTQGGEREMPRTPPPRDDAAVVLDAVTKRFDVRQPARAIVDALRSWPPRWPRERRTVLSSVSLVARRGECLGLLGPNGAGKTTIFRLIAGVVVPDEGTVEVRQRRGAAGNAVVAFASVDERSLYWRLSATENVRLYVTLYGVHGAESRARVTDSLARVGLADVGAQPVAQFSSGMRQRLLVARALALRPDVLLLDEPTRSLDPISARELRRFLKQDIVGRDGCTVLLATHNGDEAMEVCDRVAVLDRGRLLAVDGARALAERLGDARLCVWTTEPDHPAFASLAATGLALREPVRDLPRDGWSPVLLRVAPDDASGAAVLARLAAANVPISRAERMTMSLAELIERVTAAGGA
jgi:ABC-2 type transport system ATP-binding protein